MSPRTGREARTPRTLSAPQAELLFQLKAVAKVRKLCKVETEVQFHPERKWRLDVVIEHQDGRIRPIAVEIQGGGFIQGRHSRGLGMERDCEKAAHALMAGYRLLPVTPKQVASGEALQWIQELLR